MEKRKITFGDVKRANIPELYWNASMAEIPDNLKYKKRIQNYLESIEKMMKDGINLYLWSIDYGTGKTSIASIIAKEALRYGYTAFFEESGMLKSSIINKESFEEGTTVESRISSVDLLILDDLGKEYRTSSGYSENFLQTLLRNRVQNKKAVIITGNIHPENIEKIYGKDFLALVLESTIPIEISGHDYRRSRAKELNKLL